MVSSSEAFIVIYTTVCPHFISKEVWFFFPGDMMYHTLEIPELFARLIAYLIVLSM